MNYKKNFSGRRRRKKVIRKTVRLTNIPLRGHKKLFIALKKIKGVSDYRIKVLLKRRALHTPIQKKRLLLKLNSEKLEGLTRRLEGYTKPKVVNRAKKMLIKKKKKGIRVRIRIGKSVKIKKYWKKENRWRVGLKLNRLVLKNIRRHKRQNTHKGLRHQFRLPVRGQRTRSNRKTRAYMMYNKL